MAAEQAVAHIQAVAMYVQGLAERERDDAVQKQIAVLESMIKKLDGPGQVTVFKAAFTEKFHCYCNNAQLLHLHGLMNEQAAKVPLAFSSLVGDSVNNTGKQQDWHLTFWRKMPRSIWQDMMSDGDSSMAKLYKLFTYLYNSGLRNPSEKTYGAMLALSYYVSKAPVLDNGEQMYAAISIIKSNWKAFMENKRSRDAQGIVQGFRQHLPEISRPYFELDEVKFMTIFSAIPLRSSNLRASCTGNLVNGGQHAKLKPLKLKMILHFAYFLFFPTPVLI